MIWGRKKKRRRSGIPDDRTDPRVYLERLKAQRPQVESIAKALVTRGNDNAFGDEVTLSFEPRRSTPHVQPRHPSAGPQPG